MNIKAELEGITMLKKNYVKATSFLQMIPILIILALIAGCENGSEPNGTAASTGVGPGGPAIILGTIAGNSGEVLDSSEIQIFPSLNYQDQIVSLKVNSSDGSFMITELPEGAVDIITTAPVNYLTMKQTGVPIIAGENSVAIVCDSMQSSYLPGMLIAELQDISLDSVQASAIFSDYDCRITQIVKLSSVSPRLFYSAFIPEDKTVLEMIALLILDERIASVQPNYMYRIELP